jgi:hypothetical protein
MKDACVSFHVTMTSVDEEARIIVDDTHAANEERLSREKQRRYLGKDWKQFLFYMLLAVAMVWIVIMLLLALGYIHDTHRRPSSLFTDSSSSSSTGTSS